ncbi:MAG: protoporphyrinogen oxidase HemJ [Gammaproteobacteria bacterium]
MLWVKAFHVIFLVTWFAGLFYLPRLFVYHAMSNDQASLDRFKVMERKLYYGIMAPGALLTIVTGIWMLHGYAWQAYSGSGWLHTKLLLIAILIAYHLYCGKILKAFKNDNNKRSHVFYRWLNEFPVLILIAVCILVIVKPF